MIDIDFKLTEDQKDWFGNRMDENQSGRVLVPTRLYKKFRIIADNEFISNHDIKAYLIDHVYNGN